MKTRTVLIVFILMATILTSCAPMAGRPTASPQTYFPAATEAPAAVEMSAATQAPYEVEMPAATEAPAAVAEAPMQNYYQAPSAVPSYAPAPTAAAMLQPISPLYPAAPPPSDNYFRNYGVNPWEDTNRDHLSTFALDVDTASYTVARRYVMDGNLPPAESVRVEEFVNYFKQDYPNPPDVAFGIYADGAPSPFKNDGTQFVRIGIQGYQIPDEQRKSASLTFVVDVSGSMDMENRLGLVKESLKLLVDRMRSDDLVTIVAYGSEAYTVLEPTYGDHKRRIVDAIDSMQISGSTNANAGLTLGYQWAMEYFRPEAINRLILCSDGVANVGVTDAAGILENVHGYTERGVTLTTIGVGMGNFNDVLMEQLADKGDGNYYYVDELGEAKRVFVDQLTSTLQVIAKDAKVQVDFNSDVVSEYRLIGYENRKVADQDFRNDSVDAGEIGAGHSVTALYAIQLRPNANGRIATVQLRWKDPDTDQVREINGNFNTFDLAQRFEEASPRYQLSVIAAQYAELLRFSPWAEGTTISVLLDQTVRLQRLLADDADVAEFVSLVTRAAQIEAIARWGL